jgi:peroxiredoxin
MEVGQKAPDINLYNSEKHKISLGEYQGKNVVVLFYPLAFSGVCTKELCEMRDNISVYAGLNADIFAISVDSVYVLAKFKEDQKLPFVLLSDFNRDASKAYDVLYENFSYDMKNVSKRAAFVVDGNGIIQYAEVCGSPADLPNFSAVQEVLENLK